MFNEQREHISHCLSGAIVEFAQGSFDHHPERIEKQRHNDHSHQRGQTIAERSHVSRTGPWPCNFPACDQTADRVDLL